MTITSSDAPQPVLPIPAGWTVTSPHGIQERSDSEWHPFGRRHALLSGSRWTACGQDANLWRRFLGLAFEAGDAHACPMCVSRVCELDDRVATGR